MMDDDDAAIRLVYVRARAAGPITAPTSAAARLRWVGLEDGRLPASHQRTTLCTRALCETARTP